MYHTFRCDTRYRTATDLLMIFDLFQILGEGDKRMITLSHRSQIRRFTGDLLRILKSSTLRQIALKDFSAAAEQTLGKPWDPVHYGVCELEDLLASVPEHIVVVKNLPDNNTIIALPKRDQTSEEIYRTQLFAIQVEFIFVFNRSKRPNFLYAWRHSIITKERNSIFYDFYYS